MISQSEILELKTNQSILTINNKTSSLKTIDNQSDKQQLTIEIKTKKPKNWRIFTVKTKILTKKEEIITLLQETENYQFFKFFDLNKFEFFLYLT